MRVVTSNCLCMKEIKKSGICEVKTNAAFFVYGERKPTKKLYYSNNSLLLYVQRKYGTLKMS